MDEWCSTAGVQDVRNLAADLHHGLHQRRLAGDADAIAHALGQAKQAGVPEQERERMAIEQFQRLFDEAARRKSKQSKLRRRIGKTLKSEPELASPAAQGQLEPGPGC
jgi:hypothetical protein